LAMEILGTLLFLEQVSRWHNWASFCHLGGCLLWAISSVCKLSKFLTYFFSEKVVNEIWYNMGLVTIWAIYHTKYLVTPRCTYLFY
jgi:hypothetical protein